MIATNMYQVAILKENNNDYSLTLEHSTLASDCWPSLMRALSVSLCINNSITVDMTNDHFKE